MKGFLGGILVAGLLGSPAFAQSSAGSWNELPDRFQVDTGYFRISAETVLRYNGRTGGRAGATSTSRTTSASTSTPTRSGWTGPGGWAGAIS